jgi:class 3 adenylate cyclase/tetratricopeptide (TPR) repeat protein/tRNA A-37 threonylcarbamoyl transferase component Bud32
MTSIDVAQSRPRVEAFRQKHRIALMTMLFTDIEGSTKLKQILGDRAAIALIQQHHAAIRNIIAKFPEAEEIGTAGDSFFIVFAKPSEAVQFALLMQNEMRRLRTSTGHPVLDRIGIHVGEVFVEDRGPQTHDLFGIQIDTASRVMSLGNADQILLSRFAFDSARQVLRGAEIPNVGELTWLNHGYYEMKGVDEPMEVCEVGETGFAVLSAPADSGKARRHRDPTDEPVLGWRPASGQVVPKTQWVLEHCLGEGGFGEVWLASHRELGTKRVFKFCFKADRARSLKREVTLFRILREHVGQHPNIVAIHDVFFEEAPFYIVMDYVEGPTFDVWAKKEAGEQSSLALRLEVVAQIADALQAAHDAGVIHRDVKPSNVLVATEGGANHAKLTDFGIGQVVNADALASGSRLGFTETMLVSSSGSGTQIYMAPERQAGQPATIRSDIYSLGVMLWQTVAGDFTRPLTSDWADSVPDPLLAGDIRESVAGDPQKRFAAAAELATRLRTLDDRRAAAEEEKARLAALERRAYRNGVVRTALAAGVIVIVIAGLGLAALINGRKAKTNLVRANIARDDADQLNGYLLGDLREQLEEVGRLDLLDSAAQRAQEYLDKLEALPTGSQQVAQRLLLAHNLGRLRLAQGRLADAREVLRKADASSNQEEKDPGFVIARARVLDALCDLLARTGENAEGQSAGQRSLALLSNSQTPEATAVRADTLTNLCDLQRQVLEYDKASASISQSLQLLEPLLQSANPRAPRRLFLRALLRAGDLAAARADSAGAEQIWERRLTSAKQFADSEPLASLWKVEMAASHDRYAQYWLGRGDLTKAASAADSALVFWRELLAHDPENFEWLRSQATAQTKRGQIYLAAGDSLKARDLFTEALTIDKRLVEMAPRNLNWRAGLATAHSLLSESLALLGNGADSLKEAQAALQIRVELFQDSAGHVDADNTRNLAVSLVKTATTEMQNGDYPQAEKRGEEAVRVARELAERPNALPDHRSLLAGALETYAETLVGQERQTDGLKLYEEARSIRLSLAHEFPKEVGFRRALAGCHESIAGLHKDKGDKNAAVTEIEAALSLRRALAQELSGSPVDKEALARCDAALHELDQR